MGEGAYYYYYLKKFVGELECVMICRLCGGFWVFFFNNGLAKIKVFLDLHFSEKNILIF